MLNKKSVDDINVKGKKVLVDATLTFLLSMARLQMKTVLSQRFRPLRS